MPKEEEKGYRKYPNKGKGKKPFRKEDIKEPHGVTGLGDNDISWWTMSEQLLKDVARLPFGRPLGNAQALGMLSAKWSAGPNSFVSDAVNAKIAIPGIAVINYINTYGISGDAAAPINVAARAIYSFVRHANSGHTNYESPDLMIYLFAVSEIFTAISFLTKVYGCAQYWSQRNRYLGDRLITALGFDPVDVRDRLNDLRTGINILIVKANSLVAPKMFPLFARRYFLPSAIYKDQDNEKAQIYTFKPVAIGRFSGTKVSTGSALIPVAVPWTGSCQVTTAINFVSDLLDEMLAEEDLGIMGGDILKAFGKEGIHQLLQIPDNYFSAPLYNEEMLQQIHNMNIGVYSQPVEESDWGTYTVTVTTDNDVLRERAGGLVAQNNGYLLTERTVRLYTTSISSIVVDRTNNNTAAVSGTGIYSPKVSTVLLDTHLDDPSPEDVMIATRLAFDIDENNSYSYAGIGHRVIKSIGTEGIVNIDVSDTIETRTLSSKAILESRCEYGYGTQYTTLVGVADDSNNSYEEDHRAANMLLKFRKAPVLVEVLLDYALKTDGSVDFANSEFSYHFFNDVDVTYCGVLDNTTLENLHQTAILSVFKVPQMGMWNVGSK